MKDFKRALVLNSIIEAYLKENTPVGSATCEANLNMAASTIRLYFKKLDSEGAIEKLHISSGRVPTLATMKQYWQNAFDPHEKLIINNVKLLAELAKEFEIYCLVYAGRDLILQEIESVNNKFLVLDFNKEEVVLKFDPKAHIFLQELVGLDFFSIENLALRLKFDELLQKLSSLGQSLSLFRTNEKRAYQIYQNDEFVKLLDAHIHQHFKSWLEFSPLFNEGFMGLLFEAEFLGKQANIILAGSVYTDFKKVINHIKEVA
ncbi:HrcA family transcriptional regulator [Campylobacter sp. MIT 99-7217]|uniref:HrcA family transcriptional regulator n=1 Tax=Campylobacter sp. MIT 99-7217 TaxID=535091 RepID=UPI001158E1CF|nr:HrcA family transcriptional regulator [Campylobacter sp. MIT 99-7217]TQR28931.1 HrcA family transcriptional regulator [Campylobacter sp. MIT 99-7217]